MAHYVSEQLHSDFCRWQNLLSRHDYMELDVLEFRRAFEGVMAGLAAETRDRNRLERIPQLFGADGRGGAKRKCGATIRSRCRLSQAVAGQSQCAAWPPSSSLLAMRHCHTAKIWPNMLSAGDSNCAPSIKRFTMRLPSIIRRMPSAPRRGHIDYVKTTCWRRARSARESRAQALAHKDQLKIAPQVNNQQN